MAAVVLPRPRCPIPARKLTNENQINKRRSKVQYTMQMFPKFNKYYEHTLKICCTNMQVEDKFIFYSCLLIIFKLSL